MIPLPPISTLFPYTTLFRSRQSGKRTDPKVTPRRLFDAGDAVPERNLIDVRGDLALVDLIQALVHGADPGRAVAVLDRKSTRLNSSHPSISYAVFCLKKKKR